MSGQPVRDDCAGVADQFAVAGRFEHSERYGSGHIHDTYLASYVDTAGVTRRAIIQRLNQRVFPDPDRLMANVHTTTTALAIGPGGATLRLIPTVRDTALHRDSSGECWRCFDYIDDSRSLDSVDNPGHAFEAARAFGSFATTMAPHSDRLDEIIVDFHHTPRRLAALECSLRKDRFERRRRADQVLRQVERLAPIGSTLVDAIDQGLIPRRVAHSDAKINNVLFDTDSDTALCVVDVDTVMPGTPLCDFGDLVRTATCGAPEDCTALDEVTMDESRYEAIHAGFVDSTAALLDDDERRLMPVASVVITFETGVRFLTDYLNGDQYFRTTHPEHNLDRAQCQLHLALDIAGKLGVQL